MGLAESPHVKLLIVASQSSNQIYITGCGRSGTSMVAGLFRRAGFYAGGNLHPARESNPLGFFEAPAINQLNEQILLPCLPGCYRSGTVQYGCDAPRMTHTWLARLPQNLMPKANASQREAINTFTAEERFCYKDTRFCYTIHEWLVFTPEAKVICVFRNPADVVASILKECHTQPYLYDFSISVNQAFEIWLCMYRHVIYNHYQPDNWLVTSYESVLTGKGWERLESFTQEKLDFSFPITELNRSSGDYSPGEECMCIYNELKRLEREHD